eukprot:13266879-Alexandrium_andersonii.AAC.1
MEGTLTDAGVAKCDGPAAASNDSSSNGTLESKWLFQTSSVETVKLALTAMGGSVVYRKKPARKTQHKAGDGGSDVPAPKKRRRQSPKRGPRSLLAAQSSTL